jgi:phage shock protein A
VRLGAIRGLGVLRDERALAVLENFAGGSSDAAETTAANRAMEQIRSARRTGNELQSLRSEVLELKKQNDELKKSFEEIKKQMQARPATATNAPAQKSRPAAGRRR